MSDHLLLVEPPMSDFLKTELDPLFRPKKALCFFKLER